MPEPRKSPITAKTPTASPAKIEPPAAETWQAQAETAATASDASAGSEVGRETERAAESANAAGEQAAQAVGDMQERTTRKSLFFAEESVRLTSRNMEALIICTNAAAKAAEDMTHKAMDFGQRNFRHASTALRSLSEARSATALLTLQTEYVQAFVEDLVEEGCRLSDSAIRMFGEVMEPMTTPRTAQA